MSSRTPEQQRIYYQRNKDRIKAKCARYYERHREQRIAYASEYQKRNKDRKQIWNKNDRHRVRAALLILLGGHCVTCGTDKRIELDHINGGGTKDRIAKNNNWDMYRYYLKHPNEAKEKLQLLCKPHNLRKEADKRERWPNQT